MARKGPFFFDESDMGYLVKENHLTKCVFGILSRITEVIQLSLIDDPSILAFQLLLSLYHML